MKVVINTSFQCIYVFNIFNIGNLYAVQVYSYIICKSRACLRAVFEYKIYEEKKRVVKTPLISFRQSQLLKLLSSTCNLQDIYLPFTIINTTLDNTSSNVLKE